MPSVVPSSAGSPSSSQGDASRTTYEPLGTPKGPSGAVAKVSLPIPIGEVASNTSRDIERARGQAQFDPSKIEEIIRDGRIDNDSRKKIIETLDKDEVFGDWKKRMLHLNREQQMTMSHKACRRLLDIAERDDWDTQEIIEAAISLDLQSPVTIHWVAFVPVIMGQGSAEQVERWGEKAMNHEILGAYLQTELGHGTNVQGLETLATYDEANDCFDVHSPTLTSTKWWAGGSGLTCTHGIVQAQLIIKGKSHGPHLFFVPMRSLETHEKLPGIVAGDIGPKTYGAFGGLDNGWVRFDHVKIPRDNMLGKHAHVKKGGEYVKPPSDKLSYGGMIFIRSQMIDRTGWMLSRGITIATRYSTVRRQFRDPDAQAGEIERSVLSYPSLNRKLMPLLAKSFAYIIAGRRMRILYEEMAGQLDNGDTTLLADVHVASSSLKAYCTKQSLDGIEECRQSLGGHGFSAYAGFSSLFPDQAPTVIYEGMNPVLAIQVGRAMLKISGELKKDPQGANVSNTTDFLRALDTANAIPFSAPRSAEEWLKPESWTNALRLRTARRVADLRADMASGRRFVELSHECQEVASSHAEVVVNTWFAEGVTEDSSSYGAEASSWLNKLVALNGLVSVARDLTPLVLPAAPGRTLAGYKTDQAILGPESVLALEQAIRTLVETVLPQAIPLTDAFGWSDWELGSSLGRKDGRVYESLMAEAEGNPINHAPLQQVATQGKSLDALDHVGRYNYSDPNVGKYVSETFKTELKPLFEAAAKRSSSEPIRGDGSKL
ncbi:unnamed protein product [Sympodiomycopsis kandeliae]